jgi:hypothetical protein
VPKGVSATTEAFISFHAPALGCSLTAVGPRQGFWLLQTVHFGSSAAVPRRCNTSSCLSRRVARPPLFDGRGLERDRRGRLRRRTISPMSGVESGHGVGFVIDDGHVEAVPCECLRPSQPRCSRRPLLGPVPASACPGRRLRPHGRRESVCRICPRRRHPAVLGVRVRARCNTKLAAPLQVREELNGVNGRFRVARRNDR